MDWFDQDGQTMEVEQWNDPRNRTLQYAAASTPDKEAFNRILLIVHGTEAPIDVRLPVIEGVTRYIALWSSADERPSPVETVHKPGDVIALPARRCGSSARSDTRLPPVGSGAVGSGCVRTNRHTALARCSPQHGSDPGASAAGHRRRGCTDHADPAAGSVSRGPPGGFHPKAFAGEVIPFRVVAFREGHDIIGVHLRLRTPNHQESLHRLTPLQDGTDRWQVDIALDEEHAWTFRFERSPTSSPPGRTPRS